MTEVHFSDYPFQTELRDDKKYIFDIGRKKWVVLTPEEWVRQHILHFLASDMQYPLNHIAVERAVMLNSLQKRCDLVVFAKSGSPAMIVECKAPEESLNQKVFEQIARYNLSLNVSYLWVTNGQNNFCCKLKGGILLLPSIPTYEQINT